MADKAQLERALRNADAAGDTEAAQALAAALRQYQPAQYSRPVEAGRALTQGVTFGFGDEVGSGIAAGGVVATTDKSLSDLPQVYGEIMEDMKGRREAYSAENPVESLGLEMAGAVGTGVAGANKLMGTKAVQTLAANTPRWATASAMGGAEGALYGAGSADPGSRMQGAAIGGAVGAIAAPVAGLLLDKVAGGIQGVMRWAKNSLTKTPKNEAIQSIRTALQAEGLDPDDAIDIYRRLGPEATLADVGENFRALARASVDVPGPAKAQARNVMNARQMGQQGRLMSAAEEATGAKAAELTKTVKAIAERRAAEATPAYEAAWAEDFVPSGDLAEILNRPAMKKALARASYVAGNMGDKFDPGTLKHLHYAKIALDDIVKREKFPRHLMQLKGDFLREIDAASPAYRAARAQFAGESDLLDAAIAGRGFLKAAPDELAETVAKMTPGEVDLFKLGAMSGIQDLFDDTRLTHDAASKLVLKPATLKRLATVFGDEESAKKFLEAAWRETEMGRTRAVLTGGSPTAERLAGQKWLEDAVQPESLTMFLEPKTAMVAEIAKAVFAKKPLSQEALGEISNMLLSKGIPEAEVRAILSSPKTMQILTNLNREMLSRAGAASAIGPIMSEQQ